MDRDGIHVTPPAGVANGTTGVCEDRKKEAQLWDDGAEE
jgi:hypothetical protein